MTLDLHGRTCECGSFGCLNQYSSLEAIRKTVIQHLRRGKPSVITSLVSDEQEIDYHVIFKALELADQSVPMHSKRLLIITVWQSPIPSSPSSRMWWSAAGH